MNRHVEIAGSGRAPLRRRSAINPEIGRVKSGGRLVCCTRTGIIGDAIFAVLRGRGHNIRNLPTRLGTPISAISVALPVLPSARNNRPCAEIGA